MKLKRSENHANQLRMEVVGQAGGSGRASEVVRSQVQISFRESRSCSFMGLVRRSGSSVRMRISRGDPLRRVQLKLSKSAGQLLHRSILHGGQFVEQLPSLSEAGGSGQQRTAS